MQQDQKIKHNTNLAQDRTHRGSHILYLVIVGVVFVSLTIIFLFFPRTRFSELEKRDLATFPIITEFSDDLSLYTSAISHWFSDSEPFRDEFMTLSMMFRDFIRFNVPGDDESVSFRPTTQVTDNVPPTEDGPDIQPDSASDTSSVDDNAKVAAAGIFIVGTGENVRALMAYGGSPQAAQAYVNTVNAYAQALPGVNVYALPIPTSTEFYLPEKVAKSSKPQKPTIDHIRNGLNGARFVDAYSQLANHKDEDIYFRTDHHWAPLGAFYAAKALAETAGVPFRNLDSYTRKVVHNYVGSMYGYSKDISVKKAPEDFVYYVPKGVNEKTTYITFKLDKNFRIESESAPYAGRFFHEYKDGSGAAYCTFMGGDMHLVKISTGTPGNRRLLVLKDSFGNPIPSFLFYSFNEIHVVDFRYFTKNMKKYVSDNGITDVVLVFNIFNTCSGSMMNKIRNYLTWKGDFESPEKDEEEKSVDDENIAEKRDEISPADTISEVSL